FNYASGGHNVVKVNGTGFQQCTTTSSNGTLTSGRDVIALQTSGRKWYILCGYALWLRNMEAVSSLFITNVSGSSHLHRTH
ncbi:basic blue protein-like protein, partial [Tanacetum coccineum]